MSDPAEGSTPLPPATPRVSTQGPASIGYDTDFVQLLAAMSPGQTAALLALAFKHSFQRDAQGPSLNGEATFPFAPPTSEYLAATIGPENISAIAMPPSSNILDGPISNKLGGLVVPTYRNDFVSASATGAVQGPSTHTHGLTTIPQHSLGSLAKPNGTDDEDEESDDDDLVDAFSGDLDPVAVGSPSSTYSHAEVVEAQHLTKEATLPQNHQTHASPNLDTTPTLLDHENPHLSSAKGKEVMHGERSNAAALPEHDPLDKDQDVQPGPSKSFKYSYDYAMSATKAAALSLKTAKTIDSDPSYNSPFVDDEMHKARLQAHGANCLAKMFSEGLEKVKMLPEPWNNVGQVWVEKAMYDFPMRVYLGPFMEEYSRLEGTEERAKFLDDVYNGCEAKGIQSFCKLFPDADPDHARRKTMDSDARAKYISVWRQWISKRVSRIMAQSAKSAPAGNIHQKQAAQLQNLIIGLFRNTAVHHLFGRQAEAIQLVQDELEIVTKNWHEAHPGASSKDLQKNSLNFLCAARRAVFERLPEKEKAHWTEQAMNIEPKTVDELGMLVEAAFPIVSNFLAAVADRTLWRAMFVGMARTSDGNYNLMLSEQRAQAGQGFLSTPAGVLFINNYKLWVAAKYRLEASAINVLELPEPNNIELPTTVSEGSSIKAPAASDGNNASTAPTFREISDGETLTKDEDKLQRRKFSDWIMDNFRIFHSKRPKWTSVVDKPDTYYLPASLPYMPGSTTRRYYLCDPKQMLPDDFKAIVNHICQSSRQALDPKDAFQFRGQDGRSTVPVLQSHAIPRPTITSSKTSKLKKQVAAEAAVPPKTALQTRQAESDDDDDDDDDDYMRSNHGEEEGNKREEEEREREEADTQSDGQEEVQGALDPMSDVEDEDDSLIPPKIPQNTKIMVNFTTLRLFLATTSQIVSLSRSVVVGVSNWGFKSPLSARFPHAMHCAAAIEQVNQYMGMEGTIRINGASCVILQQADDTPSKKHFKSIIACGVLLPLSVTSQSIFPQSYLFREFLLNLELFVNSIIQQLSLSKTILGGLVPGYYASPVRLAAYFSRSRAFLIDRENAEDSNRDVVERSKGIQTHLSVVLAATAAVRYLHIVLRKVAVEYAADEGRSVWTSMVALVNLATHKLSKMVGRSERGQRATLLFSYEMLDEQLPIPIQQVLGTILMQASWWQLSTDKNPLCLEVNTSVKLLDAGMKEFISGLSQLQWSNFTFFEQYIVIILMFFTAIQVSSQPPSRPDEIQAMESLIRKVLSFWIVPTPLRRGLLQGDEMDLDIDIPQQLNNAPPVTNPAMSLNVPDGVSPAQLKRKNGTAENEHETRSKKPRQESHPPRSPSNAAAAAADLPVTPVKTIETSPRQAAKHAVNTAADAALDGLIPTGGKKKPKKPSYFYEPCTSPANGSAAEESTHDTIRTGPQHRPRRNAARLAVPSPERSRGETSKPRGENIENVTPAKAADHVGAPAGKPKKTKKAKK